MYVRSLMFGLVLVAACGGNDLPDGPPIQLIPVTPTAEAAGAFNLVVRRVGDPSGELSFDVTVSDLTATAGADYTASAGSLRWADGDSADKTISIALVNDLAIEGDETIALVLRDPMGARVEGATLVIQDDDRLGEIVALTNQRLVSFDIASPSVLRHAAIPWGLNDETILGLDVRPRDGKVYVVTSRARIYTLDPITGETAGISTLAADPNDASAPFTGLDGAAFGLDFNPVADRLRIVSNTGQNLRIDVENGRTTTDATIRGSVTGLAAAGYTNSFAEACRTKLYGIDVTTGRLVVQDPPNDGTTTAVGAGLGVSATTAAFDMVTSQTGATSAFAVLTTGGNSALYLIDLGTGAAVPAGAVKMASGETVRDLTLRPAKLTGPIAQAAGELYGVTDANRLISFNRGAPAKPCTSAMINGISAADMIVGLDSRPSTGLLYALTNNAGAAATYVIDPATGAASNRTALTAALVGSDFGVDFNPTGPVALRIVSNAGQNLRVTDLATGATTTDAALNGPSLGAGGAAYTNAVPGAGATTLYTIDPATDRLRIQNPPNAGTQVDVGALGLDVAAVDGFDIDGRDNVAFVALSLAGSTSTTFHTVDLTTGAVSASLGALGTRLRGMTRTSPTTTVFGLIEPNQLVTVSLANPSTPTPVGNISGLAAGESLLGIDFRPSTGLLHGIGSLGGIYTIDPATAAATRLSILAADPTDLSSPFATLSGSDFGVDFNPTGPVALRVVSDAEQNLRIPDIGTGVAITDLELNTTFAPAIDVRGAAYSNSFPGALTTTLYVLDLASTQLMIQSPPNNGVLAPVGGLSTTRTFDRATFDIAGGANGLSLAALRSPGETFSRLYRIDLATGLTTEVGTGIGSGAAMRGLAIRVR